MAPGKDMRRPDLSEWLPSAVACRPVSTRGNRERMGQLLTVERRCAVVPYQEPTGSSDKADFSSTISSTMPMAAMFTRNKYVGWYGLARPTAFPQKWGLTSRRRAAVVFSIQTWLGEGEEARKASSTPGYFSVLMSSTCPPMFLAPSVVMARPC